MSYVDQSRRPSPASMAAVVGIHAAIAGLLVTGLTVSGVIEPKSGPLISTEYKLPPPPPEPEVTEPAPRESASTPIFTPAPKLDLKPTPPMVDTTDLIPPPIPLPQPGRGPIVDIPRPEPLPSFKPVAARPKNDPARWLSNSDYRPSWTRRELTGLAKFRLEIAANGRVTDCTVTGTTGHSELDAATCSLVTKRARFEPARGGNGEPVAGSYSGSVLWQLPE